MTDPTPAEVIAFLNGEAALDGLWFHDPYPATHDRRGPFWWRKYLPLLATPDAGEVRTYREGVEDAARVADELANVPAVGHSPADKFHNRIERTMARTIAAAIRKLP